MSAFFIDLFYKLLILYIRMDYKYDYINVIFGKDLSIEEREAIYAFRLKCYKEKNKYLIPDTEMKVQTEKKFDLNSYHFRVLNKDKELVAVVRLLPYPFEMSSFSLPAGTYLSQFENFLEISRLVTNKPGRGIGKRLLILAGIWAIREKKYDGFLAVCRKSNYKLFSLFGLSSLTNFSIQHRPGSQYSLIKADFKIITRETFRFFSRRINPVYQLALSVKTLSRSRSFIRSPWSTFFIMSFSFSSLAYKVFS